MEENKKKLVERSFRNQDGQTLKRTYFVLEYLSMQKLWPKVTSTFSRKFSSHKLSNRLKLVLAAWYLPSIEKSPNLSTITPRIIVLWKNNNKLGEHFCSLFWNYFVLYFGFVLSIHETCSCIYVPFIYTHTCVYRIKVFISFVWFLLIVSLLLSLTSSQSVYLICIQSKRSSHPNRLPNPILST